MVSAPHRCRIGNKACRTACGSTTEDACTAPWATRRPWRMLCSAYPGPGSLTSLATPQVRENDSGVWRALRFTVCAP